MTAVLVSGAGALVPVAPAHATASVEDLASALADCAEGDTVRLAGDVSGPTDVLTTGCDVTLDLDGHRLEVESIDVGEGTELAIMDGAGGGELVADSSRDEDAYQQAGIDVRRASLVITSGDVTALGSRSGAGIGSGTMGDSGGTQTPGPIVITGGDVTATGGQTSAGIGGGAITEGGVIDILGGTVTATAGDRGLGIGGGEGGAVVENNGVIALAEDLVLADAVEVRDNHHVVSYDADGGTPEPGPVTVFAPSLADGYRTPPAEPVRAGLGFVGWRSADSSVFDHATRLAGTSPDGTPVEHTVRAHYGTYGLAPDLDGQTVVAGEPSTFTPRLTLAGDPAAADPSAWEASTADGSLQVDVDGGTGAVTVRSEAAGNHSFTLAYRDGGVEVSTEVGLTVTPADVDRLVLTASAERAGVGDTVEITAEGLDAFGNRHGDVTDQIELSSDVETDVVEGSSVTFTSASPHTITATHVPSGATAQVVVEVDPADEVVVPPTDEEPPAPPSGRLPLTGLAAGRLPAVLGLGLLVVGGAALVASMRRRAEAAG